MRVKQEKIIFPVESAFKAVKYTVPYFDMSFHHHPEYELVYISQGSGTRNIGASIHKYEAGDMVLIGPGLAHVWMSPQTYLKEDSEHIVQAFVVQFHENLLTSLMDTPEFNNIKVLLERSHYGVKVSAEISELIAINLEALLSLSGIDRIRELLKILDLLSHDKQQVLLNRSDYPPPLSKSDGRINAVHQFVVSCYDQQISSRDGAQMANMEHSAFCRLFKSKTQKTFTQFLNATRIDQARQLLLENQLTVTQIAYQCGFNNLGHFYKQFKKVMGMTPRAFFQDSE